MGSGKDISPIQSYCAWGCLDYGSFLGSLHILEMVCMNKEAFEALGTFLEVKEDVRPSHLCQVTCRTDNDNVIVGQVGGFSKNCSEDS